MFDIILRHAILVLPTEAIYADLAIQNGKIAAILSTDASAESAISYDLRGKIIFPGLIDSHAHVSFCGDFTSGTRAAALGGITTLIEMPTSSYMPHILNHNIFADRISMINQGSFVDIALWGGLSPEALSQADSLIDCGAAAFKVFMSNAGDYPSFTDMDLINLFEHLRIKQKYALIGVHAETEEVCKKCTETIKASAQGAEANNPARPVISELLAVSRLCAMALYENAHIHICHVSSPEIIDLVKSYRQRGLHVTIETCPHYLLLNEQDVVRCGVYAKCAPPLRSQNAQNGLWEKIIDGTIDIIGSDHAAYTETQKETPSFWESPGGFPGLDLILSGLYTEGVCHRGLTLPRLSEICSSNAAKTFGLSYRKGFIKPGMDADLTVFDPKITWFYHASKENGIYISPKYPYEGKKLQGKVTHTFVRGIEVYNGGVFSENLPGNFIPALF